MTAILASLASILAAVQAWHVFLFGLHVLCVFVAMFMLWDKGYATGVRGWALTIYVGLHGVFGVVTAILLRDRPKALLDRYQPAHGGSW